MVCNWIYFKVFREL